MDFPILSSLILLPTIGAFFIFFVKSSNKTYQASKYIALFIALANFIISLYYGMNLIILRKNFSLQKIEFGLKIL